MYFSVWENATLMWNGTVTFCDFGHDFHFWICGRRLIITFEIRWSSWKVSDMIFIWEGYGCTGRKVESILQNFLESIKSYNNSNSNYIREKTLKLRSPLFLRLGSLRSGRKWILFSIDRVNVKLLQNFSPWMTDWVTQLLSNEIPKRLRQKLELNKLVDELNSL